MAPFRAIVSRPPKHRVSKMRVGIDTAQILQQGEAT